MYIDELKGPFSKPFFDLVYERLPNHKNEQYVPLKEIFSILHSQEFMSAVPLYANSRETWANIELISATIILFKKNLIPNFRIVYTAV